MSIAVTGGCGFIGAAIVKELNNRELGDIDIVDFAGIDDKWKNLTGLVFNEYLTPDEFIPSDYELIFHLGANSATGITFEEALHDYNNALALFRAVEPEKCRVIYASSAGTYGTDGETFSDEMVMGLKPKSPYAICKHMIDMHALLNELPNVYGVKYSNVFGPGEYHKGNMASMVLQWFKMIQDGDPTPLFNPADSLARDFIYVKDAARMTVDLGFAEDVEHGAYNIGSGEATLFSDVLTMLYDLMDAKLQIEPTDMPDSLKPQYQRHTCLDMSSTEQVIDADTMSLQDAIFDYIGYMKDGLHIGETPCPVE